MHPVLSVIIVTWRSHDEIGPCVRSLPRSLRADGRAGEVEVIVVDNSRNSDGTADLLAREARHVRCILPEANLGFGRANNLGFRETTGECVLFLNPDTVSNAAALEHCLRRLQSEPDIGLISPKLVLADGSMDLACRRSIPTLWDGFCRASGLAARFSRTKFFAGYNLTHLPESGTYDVGAINGAFMMARREVLERVAESVPSQAIAQEDAEKAEARKDPYDRTLSADASGSVLKSSASSAASCENNERTQIFDERFFMYGDDLDLCIRVARAGLRIVYDGRVRITHLKGMSVARDYDRMGRAIFDANRDVYLKHFNPRGSRLVRWKYTAAFGLWKTISLARARLSGRRRVRPM